MFASLLYTCYLQSPSLFEITFGSPRQCRWCLFHTNVIEKTISSR